MLTLKLSEVGPVAANVLSLCWPKDRIRVCSYINRAVERLLAEGKWKGTVADFRICVTNGCLVWPRQIETIEAYAICKTPGTLRSGWFQYIPSGPGILSGNTCAGSGLIDREDVCSFDNVIGTGKQLAVYCDLQEDAGTTITLQYNDAGGNFARKKYGSEWIDGERIALPPAGTYAYSSNAVAPGGLVRVYKSETKGIVRLYEYDPVKTLLRPLGYYAPDEKVPVYRSSEIPGFVNTASSTTCTGVQVDVRAKIRFVPVVTDDDFLVISHIEAVRLACQGVLKEENSKLVEGMAFFNLAIRLLDAQLRSWRGSGTVNPVVFRDMAMPGTTSII